MNVIICVFQQEFSIQVGSQEPVTEIKRKIEQKLGIPMASQTLSVSEWELLDGLDMEDYPIVTEGTKIDLAIGFSQPPNRIPIVVDISSQKHPLEVAKTETVRSLKEKIATIDGTKIEAMSLFFRGTELEDEHRELREYGIGESSEIISKSRTLEVVLQTSSSLLNAATIPLQISDSCTVSDLRELLLSGKILPLDDYLFVHRQRIMTNGCSLRCHGVEDGDFIFVFKGTVTRSEF